MEARTNLGMESDKAVHNDVVVDNSGHAYMFKKIWRSRMAYALYATDGKGSWKAHQPAGLEGKQIEDHRITVGPDGACFVYALYHHGAIRVRQDACRAVGMLASLANGTVSVDRVDDLPQRHGRHA